MKRLVTAISAILLLTAGVLLMPSCEKDNSDYQLTIVVTANDSVRVQNANVRVFAPVTPTFIDYYDATDENGETHYSFLNKVVVEVIANKGSFKGCSFAEVNQGSNTVTIDLKPYGSDDNGCSTN
jgi:hypothetical protein